jgi:hypothetical protein
MGMFLLPEGPLIVTARPILTSEGKGPSHGVLIMGRYLKLIDWPNALIIKLPHSGWIDRQRQWTFA